MKSKQELKIFFRNYFHFKSYNYSNNKPFRLKSFTAKDLSKMPEYYIMYFNLGITQTLKKYAPSLYEINSCNWLNDKDLNFYLQSFLKSGIKKPLFWYKVMLSRKENK